MAQAVSRRNVTVQAHSRSQASPCGICAGQSGEGQVYVQVARFFPVIVIPPVLHNDGMNRRPKPGDLQRTRRGNIWIRILHVFALTSRCFRHPGYFMSNETGLNGHKQYVGRGWVRGHRGVKRLREGHGSFLLFT